MSGVVLPLPHVRLWCRQTALPSLLPFTELCSMLLSLVLYTSDTSTVGRLHVLTTAKRMAVGFVKIIHVFVWKADCV
jgi:hypothetical protein